MKKVIIINGSPRKNGATAKLLKVMESHLLNKEDLQIDYINISDYSLYDCIGCMSCYNTGVCCLKDQVEEINHKIANADGVIIGAPTYSSSMPGSLKTFIDRGHFVLEQALKSKYTFALSTYEISGGANVINELQTLFKFSGGVLSGSFAKKLPYNSNPLDNNGIDKKLINKTDKFYKAMISKRSKSFANMLIHKIALNIVIRPQVLKRPKQYKAVIERWNNN